MSSNCGNDGDGGDRQKHDPIEMGKLLCPKDLSAQPATDTTATSTSHQVCCFALKKMIYKLIKHFRNIYLPK